MYSAGVFHYVVFFSCIIGSQSLQDVKSDDSLIPVFACEGGVASIVCRSNKVIEINALFYGRNPSHGEGICLTNGAPSQPACKMIGFDKEEKLNNLKKACNGKLNCNIPANDYTFGDRQKCPNVTKYLNIIYKCKILDISSTSEPSTKEPVYYTGTSRPLSTTTEPTTEPYMELHEFDEDGKEWPTPRPRVVCETKTDPSDDEDLNSASSSKPSLTLFLAIVILKIFA